MEDGRLRQFWPALHSRLHSGDRTERGCNTLPRTGSTFGIARSGAAVSDVRVPTLKVRNGSEAEANRRPQSGPSNSPVFDPPGGSNLLGGTPRVPTPTGRPSIPGRVKAAERSEAERALRRPGIGGIPHAGWSAFHHLRPSSRAARLYAGWACRRAQVASRDARFALLNP